MKGQVVDTQLSDKGVLVTGANHGIGAATARAFAAEGAAVAVHFLEALPADQVDESYSILHNMSGKAAADELVRDIQGRGGHAV